VKIEQMILETGLPCNSRAMLNRLRELMDENGSNCLSDDRQRDDVRIKAVLWLLNGQVYGQCARIDMCDEYAAITKALTESEA